jgi:hypothetical protein
MKLIGAILLCLGILGIILGIRAFVNESNFYTIPRAVDYSQLVYVRLKAFSSGYLLGTVLFAACALAGGIMLKRSLLHK